MTALTLSSASTPMAPLATWMHAEQVRCPHGHHIARQMIPLPAGAVQCMHRDQVGGQRCGRWVYIVACNAASMAYVIAADYHKIKEIQHGDLHPFEAMELLGVNVPGMTMGHPDTLMHFEYGNTLRRPIGVRM